MMLRGLVGSEMCQRDSSKTTALEVTRIFEHGTAGDTVAMGWQMHFIKIAGKVVVGRGGK